MNKIILSFTFLVIVATACKKDNENIITPPLPHDTLSILPDTAPFMLSQGAVFYSNVNYGSYPENLFDIFLPASGHPTSIVIQIHGGGFKTGDKADNYHESSFQTEVNSFLNDTIAFATLNYRMLLDSNEQDGVLKSLNDCKRALQFIRYYCKDFNLDITKVALKGGSAGAGTSLWIGLNNEMADVNATDPILRESTRVSAIVCNNTQSTYDLLTWPSEVFSEYQTSGLDIDSMLAIATMETFLQFYGISDTSELSTTRMIDYRAKVNMLSFISAGDPDIYLISAGVPYTFPSNKGNLIHHPLHAKAIKDKASIMGVSCKALIPAIGIDNTNGETAHDFLVRKLKE